MTSRHTLLAGSLPEVVAIVGRRSQTAGVISRSFYIRVAELTPVQPLRGVAIPSMTFETPVLVSQESSS